MGKFILGIADDEDFIHDMIDKFIATLNTDAVDVEHFYFTRDVKNFLRDNPYGLDMLLLDVNFENSTSGVEALPTIRKYAPELAICLFTGNDVPETLALSEEYNIEFVAKPVKKEEILTKITTIRKNTEKYKIMENKLEESNQYIKLIEEDLELLNDDLKRLNLENALEKEKFIEYINQMNISLEESKRIPKDVKILMQEVFPNLEFTPYVIAEILGKNFDKNIYKILRPLNDNKDVPAGAKKKLFVEWGIDKLYEYRIPKKSRIFVQEKGGQKPLIYAVDYNHDKH